VLLDEQADVLCGSVRWVAEQLMDVEVSELSALGRRVSDPHRLRVASHGGRHLLGVLATWRIVVRHDDDLRAAQGLRVLIAPLAGPAGVARRDTACALDGVDVLLALAHVDALARCGGAEDLRQAIEDRRVPATFQMQPPAPSGRRWRNPFGQKRTCSNKSCPFSST
jgi:hypothetical protein